MSSTTIGEGGAAAPPTTFDPDWLDAAVLTIERLLSTTKKTKLFYIKVGGMKLKRLFEAASGQKLQSGELDFVNAKIAADGRFVPGLGKDSWTLAMYATMVERERLRTGAPAPSGEGAPPAAPRAGPGPMRGSLQRADLAAQLIAAGGGGGGGGGGGAVDFPT